MKCRRRQAALDDYAEVCPCCGVPAYYAADLDRWVHADGSANARCWVEMSKGVAAA